MTQSPRSHVAQQPHLSQEDTDRFLDIGCQTPQAKLAFGILAHCGCRVSQLPGLLVEDIQLEVNMISFQSTNDRKTGQTYQISIHPKLKVILETHLPASGLLFPDWHNGQVCLRQLQALLRNACKQIGLQPFSVHVFRKMHRTRAVVSPSSSIEDTDGESLLPAQAMSRLISMYNFEIRRNEIPELRLSNQDQNEFRACCRPRLFYKHDAHNFLKCVPHSLVPEAISRIISMYSFGIRRNEILELRLSDRDQNEFRAGCHSCLFYKHDAHSFLNCVPYPLGPEANMCPDFVSET